MGLGLTFELSLLEHQQAIHNLITQQADLTETLEAIAEAVGLLVPNARVSFMRFQAEANTLSLVPSRHFSDTFRLQMQNLDIGEETCSCCATANARRVVVTEDIATDVAWKTLREAAIAEGLSACWSSPVITVQGELLGTFDIYYFRPTPISDWSDTSTGELRQFASLVTLATLKSRERQQYHSLADSHRSLFLNHPDGFYHLDLGGRLQQWNDSFKRITGYSEHELMGRNFIEYIAPGSRELTQAAFSAAKGGANRNFETQAIHASGHTIHLEVTNFPMNVGDNIVGVYGLCRDITSRVRQEAELLLLQRCLEASPSGISISDALKHDTPVVYVNDAFCRITGYSRDETLGENLRFLQGEDTSPAAVAMLRRAVETCTAMQVPLLNYRKDGTLLWTQMSINPIFDSTGKCTHFIGTQQDITREQNQAARIAYQANHDLLTGLPNRTALNERIETGLQRNGQNQNFLAILHLDLDGFKTINDGLGYSFGDKLLIAVAERLRQLLGAHDTLAYLSGDEFIVLMPNPLSREEVGATAERVLAALESSFEIGEHSLHISASIGVACSDANTQQTRKLLRNAAFALGEAKRQGRNTWKWYQKSVTRKVTSDYVLLRHDLHAALRDDEFELYYQPIVDAKNGQIRSVETLLRWHHPVRGIVSPGVFIPLAEQTGQIIPLGSWVLRHACQGLADLRAKGERAFPVAVNISPMQLFRDGFLEEVRQILKETGLPPEFLELEMTESVLLGGAEKAIDIIRTLRDMGISIAIDDFGTGFSSLSYLRDLPANKIKLDRAFIHDILKNRANAAIVNGIITMAHQMDMVVVAEGIETKEQHQDLLHRNCDLLQGFLFSRPIALKELTVLPDFLPL